MKKFLLMLCMMFALTGCASTTEPANNQNIPTIVEETENIPIYNEHAAVVEYIRPDIPAYSGTAVIELNNNVPNLNRDDANTVFENYSELDEYGRCGVAYANICKELMPTEERGAIGHIKPTGWHTVKYDHVDGKYLYNRCHLIAFCLAGENDNVKNLVTGTRSFNVKSMYYYEDKVNDYMKANPNNHVLYRVTPIFVNTELVCRGVQMEAMSIEDDGILFNVFCYNVEDGVSINYYTGESWLTGETPGNSGDNSGKAEVEIRPNKDGITYMLNTNSMKIHTMDCRYANSIKEEYKEAYNGTLEYLESEGYEKCKVCNPTGE